MCIFFVVLFVLAFYAEIQDGCQNWRENDFWKKSPVVSADTMRIKNFVEIEINTFFFPLYAEIQDGRQKWPENNFCQNLPVHSADTLWLKNFVKIALAHTVSKINAFLRFTQKFKTAAKSGGKTIFAKNMPVDSADILGVKKCIKIALACTVSKINSFLRFTQKFKMAAKSGGKMIFGESHQYTLQIKNFIEIALARTVSEINAFLQFAQKLKMAAKSGEKRFLPNFFTKVMRKRSLQKHLPVKSADTLGVKISSKSFPR